MFEAGPPSMERHRVRRHRKREYEGKPYPMMMNSAKAVMACRILFSLFHRRDNSLQIAARGSVNGPLSLQAPWGSGNL